MNSSIQINPDGTKYHKAIKKGDLLYVSEILDNDDGVYATVGYFMEMFGEAYIRLARTEYAINNHYAYSDFRNIYIDNISEIIVLKEF